jgi:hypothetical protein
MLRTTNHKKLEMIKEKISMRSKTGKGSLRFSKIRIKKDLKSN